jgi:hypothetical protein
MTFSLSLSRAMIMAIIATLPACATPTGSKMIASEHIILGPKGYTVDWGLPMTGDYWVPDETMGNIKAASDACNAPPSASVYHHIPRPPWFSYLGLHFPDGTTEQQKSCVVSRIKAVPALTVYPKKR